MPGMACSFRPIEIYANYSDGVRLTSARIKSDTHYSDYAIEYDGLVRDAWDPVNAKPANDFGYLYDPLDDSRDNVTLAIHPLYPSLLLLVLTRDV